MINPSLPNDTRRSVNVSVNETPDSSTFNRSANRLLENDQALLAQTKTIFNTPIGEGLIGAIGESLAIDPNYIADVLSNTGEVTQLNDLTDVTISDTLDVGHILVYDGAQFTNIGQDDLKALYTQDVNFVAIDGYDTTSDTNEATSVLFTPINQLVPNYVEPYVDTVFYKLGNLQNGTTTFAGNAIAGVFVRCDLFGRCDSVMATESAVWAVYAKISHTYQLIASYKAINSDDDGGVSQMVFVPVDSSDTSIEFKFVYPYSNDLVLQNEIDEFGDTVTYKKNPVNSITIIGMGVKSNDKIKPEVKTNYIKGTVLAADVLVDGSIDKTANTSGANNYVWNSVDPTNITSETWESVLPFYVSPNCSTTNISFTGLVMVGSGDSSDDISNGAAGGGGTVIGKITINWKTRDVTGMFSYFAGASAGAQTSGIYYGKYTDESVISSKTTSASFGGTIDFTSEIKLGYKRIDALPVLKLDGDIITTNMAYTIDDYIGNAGGVVAASDDSVDDWVIGNLTYYTKIVETVAVNTDQQLVSVIAPLTTKNPETVQIYVRAATAGTDADLVGLTPWNEICSTFRANGTDGGTLSGAITFNKVGSDYVVYASIRRYVRDGTNAIVSDLRNKPLQVKFVLGYR